MSKWNHKPCPFCAVGTLLDGVRDTEQIYKGHRFSSSMQGAFCSDCDDGFLVINAEEEAAWVQFRDQIDAAEAAELARIRKKLKLTQSQAAQIAGGGKNAFSRYERGQAKPVAAVMNLFKLLDRHPELLRELGA